jgi:peptidyl-tRNA hydrolase, PTH1 family
VWVIAGLGNPGIDYFYTRHNAGFLSLDNLTKPLSSINWKKTSNVALAELRNFIGEDKVIIVKPQSYMNRSGEGIAETLRFYKISPDKLVVLHDELDIPLGEVKIKFGGGEAGHNGLKSISQYLGTQAYSRIRIGIGRPSYIDSSSNSDFDLNKSKGKVDYSVSSWVLSKFSKEEISSLDIGLKKSNDAIDLIIKLGVKQAQNLFNKRA